MSDEFNYDIEDSNAPPSKDDAIKKYLAFKSDDLIFGIIVENVIEIITNHSITLPNYIKGIINLRGQIIPIIDIRLRMHKTGNQQVSESCIVIIEVTGITIGILVDEMLQVFDIDTQLIAAPSKNQPFVNGLIHLADDTIMFCLDCELLIDSH